jgi:hypothetical protein
LRRNTRGAEIEAHETARYVVREKRRHLIVRVQRKRERCADPALAQHIAAEIDDEADLIAECDRLKIVVEAAAVAERQRSRQRARDIARDVRGLQQRDAACEIRKPRSRGRSAQVSRVELQVEIAVRPVEQARVDRDLHRIGLGARDSEQRQSDRADREP